MNFEPTYSGQLWDNLSDVYNSECMIQRSTASWQMEIFYKPPPYPFFLTYHVINQADAVYEHLYMWFLMQWKTAHTFHGLQLQYTMHGGLTCPVTWAHLQKLQAPHASCKCRWDLWKKKPPSGSPRKSHASPETRQCLLWLVWPG